MRNRLITEKNLSADNYLATNKAEGIAAHEMGHVISGKIKNGKTGLDIYKETVYNIDGKRLTDGEALRLLKSRVSEYAITEGAFKRRRVAYDEIIPEMVSVNYTAPNKYSMEFMKLLKEACDL